MPKCTVYVLQSKVVAAQYHVGLTAHLPTRLAAHNAGESPHTSKYRPWRLVVAVQFASEEHAARFEKYLKSGSGGAFLKSHLL